VSVFFSRKACRYHKTDALCFTEWELVQGLRFQEQTEDDGEFIRLMYTIRLKKASLPRSMFYGMIHRLQFKYAEQISLARRRLTEEFGLGTNCDILYTLADSLYAQLRFADCFVVTSRFVPMWMECREISQ